MDDVRSTSRLARWILLAHLSVIQIRVVLLALCLCPLFMWLFPERVDRRVLLVLTLLLLFSILQTKIIHRYLCKATQQCQREQ